MKKLEYKIGNASLKHWILKEDQRIYVARTEGTLSKKRATFRTIDLFAGAGGMSLGFSKLLGHPFVPVWANDFNQDAVATYNANFGPHAVCGDIVSLLESPDVHIPEADVVIGGPPCQGFSLLNKNREGDPRKELWRPYLEVVRRCKASVFVMENVPQLLGTFEHDAIIDVAKSLGFQVASAMLCAADYGVPQVRKRAIIIGCRFADPNLVFPPRKSHYDLSKTQIQPSLFRSGSDDYVPGTQKWRTVRDAIGDLPPPEDIGIRNVPPPLDLHFGRTPTPKSIARYKAIPEEGMNRFDLQRRAPKLTPECWIRKTSGGTDLFGRLWWGKPSVTIRTEFFKPEKGRYLHPVQNRPITHREAARLQSFPDDFVFTGTKIEVARQIGNAVPPLLAARIADIVYLLLLNREHKALHDDIGT